MSDKTIFEKIIDGELPSTTVYGDEKMLAFLDINPVAKGHTLLIPKERYVWMYDVPDELLSKLFIKTKELMVALKNATNSDFIEVKVMGNEVPHFHIHLIPRFFNDGIHPRPTTRYADENEKQQIAQQIQNQL